MNSAADVSQEAITQALKVLGLNVYDETPESPQYPFVGIGPDAKEELINSLPETWKVDMELSVISVAKGWMQASRMSKKIYDALHNMIIPAGSGHVGGFIMVSSTDRVTPAEQREVKISLSVWLQCA